MKGILLISHGDMAPGMKNSLTMFFGEDIKQFATLSLKAGMGADEFGQLLREKLEKVDSGDGVIIFADMFGGTPCNQALQVVNDKIDLIVGMNLPVVMEVLSKRLYSDLTAEEIVETGKKGLVDAKQILYSTNEEVDDD